MKDEKAWVIFLFVLFWISATVGNAQTKKIALQLISSDRTAALEKPLLLADTAMLVPTLKNILDSLHQAAYLAASIDSIIQKDSIHFAYVFLGRKYNRFLLSSSNLAQSTVKDAKLERYFNEPINYAQLQAAKEKLLEFSENNGYPFASVGLSEVQIVKDSIWGKLYWTKGPLFRFGHLTTDESKLLDRTFLENHLGLKQGTSYQKDKIVAVSDKIAELPFVQESRPPVVQFKRNEAIVHLFLAPQKVNRFDFLIGVLPNNQETGKVLVTGNIEADFYNQFSKGERIYFKFEQLRPETQQLKLITNYPYVLGTPLGVDFDFGLYKRDTTYRDLLWNIGVQYFFEGGNYLKAFSKNTSSSLLTIDELAVVRNRQLPQNLDLRNTAFGLAYQLEKLDYRFNPRRGWLLQIEGNAGIKTIKKNSKITDLVDKDNPDFDFNKLYDNIDLTTFQYQLIGNLEKYFPLQKRAVLKTSLRGATTIAENPILRNEQFRIGGNQRLRGFDEESIFATTYLLGTLEYRYLISQNSYFSIFGDLAQIKNKTNEVDFSDHLLGIGAGMNFETKAGLFSISYALGKVDDTPFELRTAKIHFGFISLF